LLNSSGHSTCQVTDNLRGGSQAMTLPRTLILPSGSLSANAPPSFGSISISRSQKYLRVNSEEVSAYHTFSGVAAT